MRHVLLATACLLALSAGAARADDGAVQSPELSSHQCGLSTPYNVQVDGGGVWLYRHDGVPKEIFFHDGTLSVDRQVQAVSDADARRLRTMEDEARALMPQVADVARGSVDITFDALSGVMRAMTGSERKARKVDRHRKQALAQIDGSLGKGRWDQDVFGGDFERNVERVVEDMTGSLTRSVLWAVFTGRAGKLEARADKLDAEMDELLEARTAELERRAQGLCTHVVALRGQQDALEYRYRGEPLVMLEPETPPARSVASNGDTGHDAIAVDEP
ncbi:DUF2884 family protein [Luteimonas lutimaris]|uniref:DUF2884 family protein n=1 Tax=Luteimonas lutimaris TaxID=698645 RepID=A0ABP7M2K4_9GAMM